MVQIPAQPQARDRTGDSSAPVITAGMDEGLDAETPEWDILDEEWLSDEPELESDAHREQIDLLLHLMKWYWRSRDDIYCSGNTTVYYDQSQRTTRNFRGPDIYVVLGATPRSRNSWMIWREGGRYPNVVVELLSDSTAKVDRTTKKDLYETVWRLPEYYWFHPHTKEFKGFRLDRGGYQSIEANSDGHLWSEELGLFFGLYEGVLRLFTADGTLVLTQAEDEKLEKERALEQAEQERVEKERALGQAEQERVEKEQALQRVEQLAARLKQLGIDPNVM